MAFTTISILNKRTNSRFSANFLLHSTETLIVKYTIKYTFKMVQTSRFFGHSCCTNSQGTRTSEWICRYAKERYTCEFHVIAA